MNTFKVFSVLDLPIMRKTYNAKLGFIGFCLKWPKKQLIFRSTYDTMNEPFMCRSYPLYKYHEL
jgi:hypothetical protein